MASSSLETRSRLVLRGKHLEYFTVSYNCLEGLLSIGAGLLAGSVSLVGFGLDSVIEVTSGAALIWRLRQDLEPASRERAERVTLRVVAWCFFALAAYIAYDSGSCLLRREAPERSVFGIAIAVASLIAMPLLARAKRRVAAGLGSRAMQADARQTDFCTYLSAILLAGLLLNATLGWWWADPAAALLMVPIIANEGREAWKGHACECSGCR